MSRYIKREDVVDEVAFELMYEAAAAKGLSYKELLELEARKQEGVKRQVQKWLEQVSSDDVVKVVRCRDCECCEVRRTANCLPFYYCLRIDSSVKDNDYCSYGEKKDE